MMGDCQKRFLERRGQTSLRELDITINLQELYEQQIHIINI